MTNPAERPRRVPQLTIDPRRPRFCLVCTEPKTSEGQLCDACVARGHWVENDTVFVNIGPR